MRASWRNGMQEELRLPVYYYIFLFWENETEDGGKLETCDKVLDFQEISLLAFTLRSLQSFELKDGVY